MPEEKPWYQSKTIIGTLVSAAAIVAAAVGFRIPEAEVQSITEVILALGGAVGTGLAIWGRLTADKKIRS
ncbi:MAG: hypothetical protein PVG03_18165 [Desulfarculaceae bacterium]|jgi:hypothetical protein